MQNIEQTIKSKKMIYVAFALFIFAALGLFVSAESSKISLQTFDAKDYYVLHIINASDLENYELWVTYSDGVSSQESKYFGALSEYISFAPVGDGKYTFKLYEMRTRSVVASSFVFRNSSDPVNQINTDGNEINQSAFVQNDGTDFPAVNENAPAYGSDCDVFTTDVDSIILGESVNIRLSEDYEQDLQQISITYEGDGQNQTYLLKSRDKKSRFEPREAGIYAIEAICQNSQKQTKMIYVASLSESINQTRMIHVYDSEGKDMLGTIEFNDVRKKDISKINPLALPVSMTARAFGLDGVGDTIDRALTSTTKADVASRAKVSLDGIDGFEKSELILNDMVVEDNTLLKIEKIPSENMSISNEDVIDSYAMDLSTINFQNGTFTKIAKGAALWKCKDWNYDSRSCMGDWIKIKDLTPGTGYSLDVSPVDPGYAETGLVTVNTDKGIYHTNESVNIFIAVLDKMGYLVKGANITLNITSPSNVSYIYSTDDSANLISEKSKGVYECMFNETYWNGEYLISVLVQGDNLTMDSNRMTTTFYVKDYYAFDILRIAPMSIDPFTGEFRVNISIVSYAADAVSSSFILQERIPKEFILLDSAGAQVSSDATNKILTWNLDSADVETSTVSYSVMAPLSVPDLWYLGTAQIRYPAYDGESTFDEYRPWMIAADPIGTSSPTAFSDANLMGTNNAYAYDNSDSSNAAYDIDGSPNARYVTYTAFNVSGFNAQTAINSMNVTFDVATSGAFSNDQWTLQYSNDSGTSWNVCSSGSTALTRRNVTCSVGVGGWNITALSNNFQVRVGGNRIGSSDGVSLLLYETYVRLNYTPPNIVPSPITYAKNSTIIYENDSVTFNATWIDTDGTLSHWIFSWNTSSGWVNDSTIAFTSNNVSQVNKTINFPQGRVISWRFYANDSSGGWNSTPIQNFTVFGQDLTPPVINWISVSPSTGYAGTRFNLSANVTDNQIVGTVKAEVMLPNGSISNYTLSQTGTNIYSYMYNTSFGGNFSFIVYASDGTNQNLSNTRAYFNATSNLSTDKIYYARGDKAIIRGNGFSPGKNVELNILDPSGLTVSGFPKNVTTNSTGGFSFQWNISSSFATKLGNYTVKAQDSTISWLNSTTYASVVIKPTSSTIVTDDPNAPGGSAGILTMDVFSNINNSDNVYANIVSSTTEVYLQNSFTDVVSVGQDVNYARIFFEHMELSDTDIYVNWYNATSGSYRTVCTISNSSVEVFNSCDLSGVLKKSDDVNALTIRFSNNNTGVNNVNWTIIDFVYIIVNFTASSSMSIEINEPSDNIILYDYYDLYSKAYGGATSEPIAGRLLGTEATATQYNYLKTSDVNKYHTQTTGSGGVHAYQTFKFVVTDPISEITQMRFLHDGYATRTTSQTPDPFSLYVWNLTSSSYDLLRAVDGTSADVITTVTILGNGSDYINASSGEIWFLVEGSFSTGGGPNAQADVYTDYSKLDVYRVPVLSGLENINATVVDADGVNSCNYYYSYMNGSRAGNINFLQNRSANIYFNVSDTSLYTDGFYNLYVNCSDTLNSVTNASKYVKILNAAPYVNLAVPYNNTNLTYRNINFTWYLGGSSTGLGMCNLTIDSVRVATNVLSLVNQNTTYNYTVSDGSHNWFVGCIDPSGLVNRSATWYFDVDSTPPLINMSYPLAGSWINTNNVTFNYTPLDIHNIMNCSLYLDGVFNQINYSINSSNPNYFNVSSLSQGMHNWSINCTDSFGLANRSLVQNFTVDIMLPNINLSYPPDNSNFTGGNMTVNFTATDNMDPILNCNLTIDDVVSDAYRNYAVTNGSLTSITEFNIADGQHYWNISCWDNAMNVRYSQTRNFTMIGPPRIILNTPYNNTWFNYRDMNFSYFVFDGDGIRNCSIYLDGLRNASSSAIINDDNNTFNITDIAQGTHSWYIRCFDNVGTASTSITRWFMTDTTKPSIDVYYPDMSQSFTDTTITFNYSATDNMDAELSCNLTIDSSISAVNRNINTSNASLIMLTQYNVTDGVHNWNITCIDNASNVNTSLTRNFSVDTVPNVLLIEPPNNAKRQDNITFVYNASDMSGIATCSFIFDEVVEQTVNSPDIISGALSTFNRTDTAEGLHTWTVNCTDSFGLTTQPAARNITVDVTAPQIYPGTPNGTTISSSTIMFNFTAIDAITPVMNCTIFVDGNFWVNDTVALNNTPKYFNITEITDGLHYWNVSCSDEANNTRFSRTLNFTVDSLPVVTLVQPYNNTGDSDGNILFTYYVAEGNLSNCSLLLNNTVYQTKNASQIPFTANDGINNFTVTGLSQGTYLWNVICMDKIGSNGTGNARSLYVDMSEPYNVTLLEPIQNATIYVSTISFNWTVFDTISPELSCNLTINGAINKSNITTYNGNMTNVSVGGFTAGNYTWNVACTDLAGWRNYSVTRNFSVSGMVRVTLVNPQPNYLDGDGNVTFFYVPESLNDFNTIGTCELYLDGISNKTAVRPKNGEVNNITIENIPSGTHNWYVNCSDNVGTYGSSTSRSFIVDLLDPAIDLNYPKGESLNVSYVNFNFTASDNLAPYLMCNITSDGSIVASNINATNGSATNITVYGFSDGIHYWNVTCLDTGGRTNTSLTSNFTVAEPPMVRLLNPANGFRTNQVNMTFYFNVTDNSANISNCILILNGMQNNTNSNINLSQTNNVTVTDLAAGNYTWDINCSDAKGNIGTNGTARSLFIDLFPPYINLTYPQIAQTFNTNNITFNWTAMDFNSSILLSCRLFVEDSLGQGDRTVNNIMGYSHSMFNYSLSNFSDGTHYWNVTCSDDLNNSDISSTYNFIINQPDLYINDSVIFVNNTNPDLNTAINITANVSNFGGITANNLLVEFWDGHPSTGIFLGNATGSVVQNGSRIFSLPWNITEGYHVIHVLVDPYNSIAELNETNNNATYNISVLRSIINYPLNQSIYKVSNITFNFTLLDYTGGIWSGLINYSVYVDNAFNGQNGTVSDNISTLLNITFAEGVHSVKIEAKDYLGRKKNSTAVVITVDYTAPNATILTNNTWYNFTTPNISIRATDNLDANINYTIYANNIINMKGNLSNNTATSINLSALTEGSYELVMEAYDDFNNTANSSPKYIFVDLTAPNITLNSPSIGSNFTTRSVTLNYTADDNMAQILECNLSLDGAIVSSQSLGKGNSTAFTSSNLAEGTHYWNVTCKDQAMNTNQSITNSFNVYIAPSISLESPQNNNWSKFENNTFYFNVTDETGIENCSLLLNGAINVTLGNNALTNNATNNFTVINMQSGNYTWAVQCYDNTSYHAFNSSLNRTFYVDLIAPQSFIETSNGTWFNVANPAIRFNMSDNMDSLLDYILFVNGAPNVTGALTNGSSTQANLIGLTNGTYSVFLQSVDNAGNIHNTSSITLYVDSILPSVNLTSPANNTNITVTTIELNFTASDNMASLLNCNMSLDGSIVANISANVNQQYSTSVSGLAGGYHYWNVTCFDQAMNKNTSQTYRFYVVMPDLYINDSLITFSNNAPSENETINITAEIFNIGLALAQNFTVQIRSQSQTGPLLYEQNLNLSINGSVNITTNYTVSIGNTSIYVLVDVPLATNGTIKESDESNNYATKSVYVALWEFIMGETYDKLTMTDRTNQTIYDWLVSNASGSKLFAADVDSNINWRMLKALGINASNQSSTSDFATLDAALGSSAYTDSVNRTYTSAGAPIETTNYTIFMRPVDYVPIVNSTNNANFKTGILWDYGDGGSKYMGNQDILFVSPIKKDMAGYNATVDYEIRIPATLRSYKAGSDLVVFYAEIN